MAEVIEGPGSREAQEPAHHEEGEGVDREALSLTAGSWRDRDDDLARLAFRTEQREALSLELGTETVGPGRHVQFCREGAIVPSLRSGDLLSIGGDLDGSRPDGSCPGGKGPLAEYFSVQDAGGA